MKGSQGEQSGPQVIIRSLDASDVDAYATASRSAYGRMSYQSGTRFLRWMYREGPERSNNSSPLVAIDEKGCVHGFLHRMPLPMTTQATHHTQAAVVLHNLFVQESARDGLGYLLLRRAISGYDTAIVPGVMPPFSRVYEVLKGSAVDVTWLAKRLPPTRTVFTASWWLRAAISENVSIRETLANLGHESSAGLRSVVSPTNGQLDAILGSIAGSGPRDTVPWTRDSLTWRLFHPLGPMSFALMTSAGDSVALVSVGLRVVRGIPIPVSRVIHVDPHAVRPLLHAATRASMKLGVSRILLATGSDTVREEALRLGFGRAARQPLSFTVPSKKAIPTDWQFNGLASDLGFEGILPMRRLKP